MKTNYTAAYQVTLLQLADLLRASTWTVAELAEEMGCSKPVAYDRLKALTALGYRVRANQQPQAEPGQRNRGPRPVVYSLR